MPDQSAYLGIDLGGTKILSGLVDDDGTVLATELMETQSSRGKGNVLDRVTRSAEKLAEKARDMGRKVRAVGFGGPGPVDPKEGVLYSPPNLPGWDKVPLAKIMADRLGAPCFLENDANAAALGENLFGAGKGSRYMVYLTVSTGVGSGVISHGTLYSGANGFAAEAGHMTLLPDGPLCPCGNRGCLEALSSCTAIAREAKEILARPEAKTRIRELARNDPDKVTAKLVAQAAEQGDMEAKRIIAKAMEYLGMGVASLVNLLNPEMVVIGGSLANLGDAMFGPVRRAVDRRAFAVNASAVSIVPAALGDRVGILGAAALAMQRYSPT
ncbi:MAG: ROK family protein [Deltaproteobacteria bacterium]|nr:ROK family protein [Deltaproteobacteria bacterium]